MRNNLRCSGGSIPCSIPWTLWKARNTHRSNEATENADHLLYSTGILRGYSFLCLQTETAPLRMNALRRRSPSKAPNRRRCRNLLTELAKINRQSSRNQEIRRTIPPCGWEVIVPATFYGNIAFRMMTHKSEGKPLLLPQCHARIKLYGFDLLLFINFSIFWKI